MGYQFNLFAILLSINERNQAHFQFQVNAVIVCLNIKKKKKINTSLSLQMYLCCMLHISNFCLLNLSFINNAIIIFVQGQ